MIDMLPGQTYGQWTVVSSLYDSSKQAVYCTVQCSCGTMSSVPSFSLRSGRSRQCRKCGFAKRKSAQYDYEKWINSKVRQIKRNYSFHAIERGYTFEITQDKVKDLILSPCYYCGVKWSNVLKASKNRPEFYYNGIDRTDNNKGYTVENTVSCCKQCNMAKKALGYDVWSEWVERLKNNHERWRV